MLVPPASFGARGTSLINTLGNLSLMTGLQGCYDFADSNCYPGTGQAIGDLSGQANQLYNGASAGNTTEDMAFNGVAGRLSSGEFFERNGTTGTAILGGDVPTWMQAVHKDNGKISIAQWTRTPSGTYGIGSVSDCLNPADFTTLGAGFGFGVSGGGTGAPALGLPAFIVKSDAVTTAGSFGGTDTVPNTGTWMFSGCAIDEAAGTAVIQIDATQYSGSISYSSPSSGSAASIITLGPSGASMHDKAMLAFWNISIGAAGLDAVYKATKGRFGL